MPERVVGLMDKKSTYEELKKRAQDLENQLVLSQGEDKFPKHESPFRAIFDQSFQFALILDLNGIVTGMEKLKSSARRSNELSPSICSE